MMSVCSQNHIRDNWKVDLDGEAFCHLISELRSELAGFGVEIASS